MEPNTLSSELPLSLESQVCGSRANGPGGAAALRMILGFGFQLEAASCSDGQGGDEDGAEHLKRFGQSSIALQWSDAGMWRTTNS